MQRREEDGFTLVELIISMAIFSIVAVMIMMFMQTGANSYQRAKNELDLQMDSQMLINQIRDMAYSANYAEYDDSGSTHTLTLYHVTKDYTPGSTPSTTGSPASTAVPASVSKRITSWEVIVWDPATKKLYYDKSSVDASAVPKQEVTAAPAINLSDEDWRNKHLFCNYMENFTVATDASGKIPDNTIQLTINMKARSRQYDLKEDITIRNGWVPYP
ncbi:MAG: type II secretion system protein [Eubacteriales bacterium]|nr:type II secretion system protein [Eubacteriales bacterium]